MPNFLLAPHIMTDKSIQRFCLSQLDNEIKIINKLDDSGLTPLQRCAIEGFHEVRCFIELCSPHRRIILNFEKVTGNTKNITNKINNIF